MKSAILSILSVIAALTLTAGCKITNYSWPSAANLTVPAVQADARQMQDEYERNIQAADARYKGNRFYFGQVIIDKVEKDVYPLRAPEEFVLCGSVQFKPAYRGMLDALIPGSLVEISGDVVGKTSWGYIVVNNCWIKLVSGGATTTPGY